MWADSGFYTYAVVALCREMNVRFSITIRQHSNLRNLIEAIPEQDYTAFLLVERALSLCPWSNSFTRPIGNWGWPGTT